MTFHQDLDKGALALIQDAGEPAVVTRGGTPIDVRVIVEDGVEQMGEFNQVVGRRRVVTFRKAQFAPRRGDQVTVRNETGTVESIDSDDGYLVGAVLNG